MPTKKNFLGGQQNYNEKTGEYESALVGPNGKVVKDADGDGKKHESWEKDFSPEEVKKMKNEYPGKEEHIKKLKDAGFEVDEGYKAGNTFKIDGKDFGDEASISIGEDGKYFRVTKNGGTYTYKDLDTAIDRAKYTSGKAPSEDAVGWETGSYDAKTEQEFLMGKSKKQERDFNAPKKHDYSEIFDEDYQRSWGVPDFKDEDDIKTLNDIVEKAMEYDGDDGAIDISNNAMERIGELTTFTEEEQDKLASGTGEEIMDILRSKESKKEPLKLEKGATVRIAKEFGDNSREFEVVDVKDGLKGITIKEKGRDGITYQVDKSQLEGYEPENYKDSPYGSHLEEDKPKAPTYQKGVPGEDYNFYEDGNFSVKHRSPNSSFEEASVMYEGLNKFYGYDLEEMVYGENGFMKEKYPNGFPDFKGDILYSSKHWDEFEDWAKEKYGVDLDKIRKDNFEEYKKSQKPTPRYF